MVLVLGLPSSKETTTLLALLKVPILDRAEDAVEVEDSQHFRSANLEVEQQCRGQKVEDREI